MTVSAWYFNEHDESDQREPHKHEPNREVSLDHLTKLGVLQWHLDADKYENDPELEAIREERGYTYTDVITVSPEKLPGYEEKIKSFFEEHIHTDEEIRYILEGSGYFDVRDEDDKWIRILCEKGDLITLPEGINHRFTLDSNNYIKAMRLFVGEPVWTPYNRDAIPEDHPSLLKYRAEFLAAPEEAEAAAEPAPEAGMSEPEPKRAREE